MKNPLVNSLQILVHEWLAVLIFGIAAFLSWNFLNQIFQQQWAHAEGEVTKLDLVFFEAAGLATSGTGSTCWIVTVKYRVNDLEYTTTRETNDTVSTHCAGNHNQPNSMGTPDLGSRISIWYDANHPSYAVRRKVIPWLHISGLLISLTLAIIFIVYLISKVVGAKKSHNSFVNSMNNRLNN